MIWKLLCLRCVDAVPDVLGGWLPGRMQDPAREDFYFPLNDEMDESQVRFMFNVFKACQWGHIKHMCPLTQRR